jgi:hypothetical protein
MMAGCFPVISVEFQISRQKFRGYWDIFSVHRHHTLSFAFHFWIINNWVSNYLTVVYQLQNVLVSNKVWRWIVTCKEMVVANFSTLFRHFSAEKSSAVTFEPPE